MEYDLDRFNSRRSTVFSTEGMVATSQPLAAQAGVEILRDGGNAFDAAVATAAALNVTEPTSTGIGGDVFACFRTADGEVGALNASGYSGRRATLERVRERVDGDDPSMPMHGGLTVTVPGAARGWEWTLETHGRRTLADALAPAIRYATEGYPVSETIASYWRSAEDLFETPHARDAYLVDGERAPRTGEVVRLPRLGASLEAVAEAGADALYAGHLGEAIVEEVQADGGLLELDDLRDFEAQPVEPISHGFRDATVYELPPNTQGTIVLEALAIAEAAGLDPDAFGTAAYDHRLIEATKLAFHDGHRHLTDPASAPPDLLAADHIAARADHIEGDSVLEVSLLESLAESADTVLLSAADAEGNLVTFINSRFAGFGSGLVAGDTGIALQNRGASFSLDPDHPNRMAPRKRPFHTLIPAMAALGDGRWLSFGVMGGYMQPQGHIQVLSNLIDGDLSLQAALDAPRWRHFADGTLGLEARYDEARTSALVRTGHDVRIRPPVSFGGAQAISENDGVLAGATEPRKDGIVAAY